ncbi:uncharacterized protein LOC123566392 isoform X3 [Mercenaria mercenaria]|uniref:uncharacterized protein LOC123566392 isoform X3 n=1 Tax=Mercenaria mercenaria TaxID=6596 RepID=UPI00234F4A7A|nr:uncharacterized protein LOC123566392 isoform X3 [Mercenaria mercenaria]
MSNIRVALRVRPLNGKEKDEGSKEIVKVNNSSVRIENIKVLGIPEFGDSRSRIREFLFDHCYDCMQGDDQLSSQAKVFEDLGTEVLKAAFDGFNACVFAYGQTGTGKTHTMMGYPGDVGLIPRICEGLFTHMSECTDENVTCRIDVSYFEIYNERVRDLLQPQLLKLNENYSLKIREHPKEGPYVKDLSWHRVRNNEDIQGLLDKGNEYRVTAETYMHGHSSRSHAIVTVCYTQARLEENRPSEIVSKINLVDLAGSERADPSSKPDFRKRLTEGANINKSLVTLSYVIKALAERSLLSWSTEEMGSTQSFHSSGGGETAAGTSPAGPNKQRVPYIPYRDSVLTWLLKDSLGGNSKTIMIATITPASQYYSESISTLRYAQRAKNIINKPRINEDTNVALIRELRREIERLHGMLANAQMPATQLGPNYLPGDIVYFVPSLHRGPDDPENQGGNLITLPESEDSIIAEKLHENEEMAKQLTQSWMCKWSSTHDIMKESDLSIRGLPNRSSSMGVMIDSQLPYLVGMDDDVLSTGIVIFHLKEGETTVGREDADTPQDIVLHGPMIQKDHCVIQHVNGEVYLHPCPGSMCAVQDIECTEPTKLSQGDYVILGGNQVFRFNNPSEAAKLREHRKSQGSLNALNTSHLSFGGLSRASSFSSIGGDDSSFLSPPSQLGRSYPNYAAPDLCRDLEKRYQTEQERIAEAAKELERLKAEHEKAEELRQLKEEEMYQTHEQHRADIEEQKQHLTRLKEENDRERVKAEEELRLARESLAKEKDAFQKQFEEERRKLKELQRLEQQQESMGIQTDPLSTQSTSVGSEPLSTQTMSVGSKPFSTQTASVGSEQTSAAATSTDADDVDGADDITDLPVIYRGGRRLSAADQLDDLAKTEFSRRMSYRETEESLAIQQEDIEDAYLQTQEQLEDKLRNIQKIEEEYKEVDKAHLQEIAEHTEKVHAIRKQEVQLEVYIQENEELLNVSHEKPRPLRSACSEMFLLDPSIQDQEYSQRTTSLLDIQGEEGENQDQFSPRSRRLRRSSSAESLESGISEFSKDQSMETDKEKTQKDRKISTVAKQVTSRLYQAPEPKFKYVPKSKEKEIKTFPKTKPVRDRNTDLKSRTSPVKTVKDFDRSKSESPQRVTGKRNRPTLTRDTDPKKRSASAPQSDPKLKEGPKPKNAKDKGDKQDKNESKVMAVRNKAQGPNRIVSPTSKLDRVVSPTSKQGGTVSPTSRQGGTVSPTSRLGGAVSPERLGVVGPGIKRTSSPNVRHMASASSLASVPESLAENEESVLNENQKEPNRGSYGVKKRQKKGRANFIDDDFRCHSAPDSQRMSQALDEYTDGINLDLQTGLSNSDRLVPLVTTSVSVDDSTMCREEEMKISDIDITSIDESESGEMDAETQMNESCVEQEQLDSDIEMKKTDFMNEQPVHMYISSEEDSKGIDDIEKSHDSSLCIETSNLENKKDLDKSTEDSTMEPSEDISVIDDSMETSEPLGAETIVLGKRERKDSDRSIETDVPTKKSKSVSDDAESLSDARSNKSEPGVSFEVDTGNFSEDSLDLNISIDSLEGEKHTARLTQSLPAYLIRSEKPMSEDSLSDSCDEQNKDFKDSLDNDQSDKGNDNLLDTKEEQITEVKQTLDPLSLPNSNVQCHENTSTPSASKKPKLTKVCQEPVAFLPHDDIQSKETLTQFKEANVCLQSTVSLEDTGDIPVDKTIFKAKLDSVSEGPVIQCNITSDGTAEATGVEQDSVENQTVNDKSAISENINAQNPIEGDILCEGSVNSPVHEINDADFIKNNTDDEASNNILVDVSKVKGFVSDVIKQAQEIHHENPNYDSCMDNWDKDHSKIHKQVDENETETNNVLEKFQDYVDNLTNEDLDKSVSVVNEIEKENKVNLNKSNSETEANICPAENNAFNVVVANICNEMQQNDDKVSVNNVPSQKDNEVNEENEQKSFERTSALYPKCTAVKCRSDGNVDTNRDEPNVVAVMIGSEMVATEKTVNTSENKYVCMEMKEENKSVHVDQPDSVETNTNDTEVHDDNKIIGEVLPEQIQKGTVVDEENEMKSLDETKEPICQDTTDIEIKSDIGTVREDTDNARVTTNDVDEDSGTEEKMHGPVVDENHNVVEVAGYIDHNFSENTHVLSKQNVGDENLSDNYASEEGAGQESIEGAASSVTLVLKNADLPIREELTVFTSTPHEETENEGVNALKSEVDCLGSNEDEDLDAVPEKTGESNGDSEMASAQTENTELNGDSLPSESEVCNLELAQQRDKSNIEHASSSLIATRSVGVGTSQDLMEGVDDVVMGDNFSQASNDSFLLDPKEELQVLEEALEKLKAKPGRQLSTAQRAARQRAMIRQQHRGADSDGVAQLSDEAHLSGTQTKNSSRPGSGSRRRKRPSNKTADKTTKHLNDHTSDDYDSSENDSVYSDDSVDAVRLENHPNGGVRNGCVFTYDFHDDLDSADMLSRPKHKHQSHLSPGHVHQRPDFTEIVDGPDGRRTIGIQTFDHSLRNRSTGSTRTDYSDFDGSFASEGRGMVMSPLSLWNSNERSGSESHSDHNSSSSAGFVKNLNDIERSMTPTPRSSTRSNASVFLERSNLEKGPTEVWSSSSSELRPLPGFRDDLSYIIETEGMSPGASSLDYTNDARSQHSSVYMRTPREGERLIPRPDCSTPTNSGKVVNISFPESQIQQATNLDTNTPVKFEVTVHEDNTNIEYNVEKTEYKTYSLRTRNEPNIIPDRILVNLTENLNSQTQENYLTQHREEITVHQPDSIRSPEDSLVLEKSYRSSTSSERETEVDNDTVKRDESKEFKDETKEECYYRIPSEPVVRKKEIKLQHSGVVEATSYPSTTQGAENVNMPDETNETCVDDLRESLNESDYTSDYGTITSIDGRKGYMSFTSDSEDNDSIAISPRPSHVSKLEPVGQSEQQQTYLPLQNEITDTGQSTMLIPEQSQNVCPSSEENANLAVAGTQENSAFAPQIVQRSGTAEESADETNPLENKIVDGEHKHDEGLTSDLGYESMKPESSDEYTEKRNQFEEDTETDSSSVDTVRQIKDGENENFVSQETLHDVTNLTGSHENMETDIAESFEQPGSKIPKLDLTQPPVNSPQRKQRLSVSSTDETYLSLDQSESTSTCSSDYKTPQQSPREVAENEQISSMLPKEVDDVIIPDYYDDKLQSTPRQDSDDISLDQAPILTSSPKQSNDVRTVSVNTESVPSTTLSAPPAVSTIKHIFGSSKDPVHTEALKKDLEKKIAKLKRHVRSLSDSAISSDFTDGDSVSSVSPRGSRVYDDKSFLGEKRLLKTFRSTQSPTRVRQTLNFEGPHPSKESFKDSGNVYDDDDDSSTRIEGFKKQRPVDGIPPREYFLPSATPVGTFPERLIDSLLAIEPQPLQRCHSLDSLSTIINLKPHLARAVREFQSIEDIPGAVSPTNETTDVVDSGTKGNNDLMASDGARPLSPGEIGIDQDSLDDMYAEIEKENIIPDVNIQVDASQNKKISEKSTSMSVLGDTLPEREYHRSLSEGNIDDFDDEIDNSDASNDSITFVFIKDDRTKPTSETERDNSEQAEAVEGYDPCGSGEIYDSEGESVDSRHMSSPGECSYETEEANISGRGHLSAKSEDRISDVLSVSASEDSVIEYNRNTEGAEDEVSSHTASEEIEEIIRSNENTEQMYGSREIGVGIQADSPPTYTDTSDSFVQNKGKFYDDDSEPLRHKFGIDESVLPLPERSVSADNIPKHLMPVTDLMRSRSAGMLDVGVADEPESESGIFPPALRTDDDQTEQSVSLHTMSEGGLDHISQRTFSDMEASLSNRTSGDVDSENCNSEENSSAVVRSICSKSSSVESLEEEFIIDYKTNWNKHKPKQTVNHSGSSEQEEGHDILDDEQQIRRVLETVQRLICPKPTSVDRGMTTESETDSNFVSIGVQTASSETSTADTGTLQLRADQIILPALAAPFRAQSMDSFGLGASGQGLELSEESRNWCTLGELMVETTHLLRRINDRLPEESRKGSISSSEDSQVSQVILKKWQEISVQTGQSIENLTTVGSQTDGDGTINEKEKMSVRKEIYAELTQGKTKSWLQRLDLSDTITHELLPSDSKACEMSVQTDEIAEEFAIVETRVQPRNSTSDIAQVESVAINTNQRAELSDGPSQQTKLLTEQIFVQSVAPVSFSPKEQQLNENLDNTNVVAQSEQIVDKKQARTAAKYIPQVKAELGLDTLEDVESEKASKAESPRRHGKESPRRQEATNQSPNKLLPGFTLPDTPEIVELRREHAKLMENLRKASDERNSRKEKLQARKKTISPDDSFAEDAKEKSYLKPTDLLEDKEEDKQVSDSGVGTKEKSKDFRVNKNDPETETSSNSSVDEDSVRSDGDDKEQVPEEGESEDIVRSDGEDNVPSSTDVSEDIVRSDVDDKESVGENLRSDDEDEIPNHDNDVSMGSVTSPTSTQEFVQINIQVDPSTGVTVKNKTIREPSPKRNIGPKEMDKNENIREEHTWEIAGDEFRTIWDRRPELRSRTDSNTSQDTLGSSEIVEEVLAGPLNAVNARVIHHRYMDDEIISPEIIDDVLENNDTPEDHGKDNLANPVDHHTKLDETQSSRKPVQKKFSGEYLSDESDGRDSPASVVEDIVLPQSYTREQLVPDLLDRISEQNRNRDGKDWGTQLGTTPRTASQESLPFEETIVPQIYKKEHSLPPPFLNSSAKSHSELEPESVSVDDPRERGPKIQQQIIKSETSPKYKAQILREQQRQAASPDFTGSIEILPGEKVPHQHSARSDEHPKEMGYHKPSVFTEKEMKPHCLLHPMSPFDETDSKNKAEETQEQITPNPYRAESRPPRFSDDATQMSVEFSDDGTQTEPDLPYENVISQDVDRKVYSGNKSATPTHSHSRPAQGSKEGKNAPQESPMSEAKTSEEFREELESLQHERQHIMDLLGLSYLPNSLTVELLEAKLNHCIGQTDLLLDNLENPPEFDDSKKPTIDQKQTKDYISKYRADLKKSKEDIKECREQLNKGRGRGRPSARGRTLSRRSDVLNHQRQAEIDAFKLERLREQQDYERASRHGAPSKNNTPLRGNTPLKGNTPLYGNSPAVTPRSDRSRSSSPSYSPSYMNPREHKAHLVDLRRQLIKDVVEEEKQHSRSCSPLLHTSPPAVHKHRSPSEQSLGFSPKVSVSLSDIPGSPTSSSPSSGGSKTYVVAPGSSSLSPVRKPVSYDHGSPYSSYQSSPDRVSLGRRTSHSSLDRRMVAESIFSPQESEQILQEIEEYKKRTPISAPMEELLRRSSYSSSSSQRPLLRYMTLFSSTFRKRSSSSRPDVPGISPRSQSDPRLPGRSSTSPVARQLDNPLSLNLDCLRDDEAGPYSPYSAYAREHIIPNERSPTGGVLRGTYELYHDRSDTSSVLSYDSDTFSDPGHRPQHNALDEDTIKRLRPIRAEDIKARINRHKR